MSDDLERLERSYRRTMLVAYVALGVAAFALVVKIVVAVVLVTR